MGKKVFIDDQEMTNKDDFDKKVNVDVPLYRRMTNNNSWKDILGIENQTHNVLIALRDDTFGQGPTAGGNGAGIAFGGVDTKAILTTDWLHQTARIAAGNDYAPVWHEDIAWKSDIAELKQEITDLKKQIGGGTK